MIYRNDDPPECDETCEVCRKDAMICSCPECPNCGEHGNPKCFTEHELKNSKTIFTVEHLESAVGCFRDIETTVYKYTACGAWVDLKEKGWIRMGSIVEGVDEETDVHELEFGKFTIDDFNKTLDSIEEQAKEIWDRTHGCEDCYPEEREAFEWEGICPINPDCGSCEGAGIII